MWARCVHDVQMFACNTCVCTVCMHSHIMHANVGVNACAQLVIHARELYFVFQAKSKQSATSPKTSWALTVTQRTAENTCWDDGDGMQPRQHMGLILALMKTTWHKYRTKWTALETRAAPLQWCWHWRKHLIILGVSRQEKGERKRGGRGTGGGNVMHLKCNNASPQKHKHLSPLWSP